MRNGIVTRQKGRMRLGKSRITKFLTVLRRRGLVNTFSGAVLAFAQKHHKLSVNVLNSYGFVLTPERPAVLEPRRDAPFRINWLIPRVRNAQGGLFNIFRTIQQLELWGYDSRVYVVGGIPEGASDMKRSIQNGYFPIRADVEEFSDTIRDSDMLIATSWPTAYAARGVANTTRKFYFIQDLEHLFYPPGSVHEFARQTYTFGYHGITAGTWIADVLRQEYNMECAAFGFSYDREAYSRSGNRMLPPGKKRVLFYARPETERRGFELGILALSLVAEELPETEFVLVGFSAGSLHLPFKTILPGVLPLAELGALYRSCDIALVLSHTNLSLLPLELMACGCAVVSNVGANTEWLLNQQTATLVDFNAELLARAMVELLENDALRLQKSEAGYRFATSTDWETEIRKIESALLTAVPHQQVPNA